MLTLSQKQAEAVEAANDPLIELLVLLGTVGTGKTDVAAHIVLSICWQFPNTRWPVFRQNISTAQETVIPSYLDMLDKMGFVQDEDYIYREKPFFIRFANGSTIRFREADITKDRGGKKIKGMNATGNHIDEPDELENEMLVQAMSRKGRNNHAGQPSLSILSLNPTDVEYFVEIYNKFREPEEYGVLPSNIKVIEFTLEDSWQTQEDIAALKQYPQWWVQRYLYNNWKYKDEDQTIFKSNLFAKARTDRYEGGRKTSGYDVAEDGRDMSVCADWDNFTLTNITITKKTNEKVKTEKQAQWLITHSDNEEIGYENIAVDGVGIGVGVLASARQVDVEFDVYKSGFAADSSLTFDSSAPSQHDQENREDLIAFDMLRSQMAYMFATGMEHGKIKILDSCPFLKELIAEAQTHHHESTSKVFKLESKQHIKKRGGKSPDVFDAVVMGLWKQMKQRGKFEFDFG